MGPVSSSPNTNFDLLLLGGATWQSFRHLGFGIWDYERMRRLEMLNIPSDLRRLITDSSLKKDDYTLDNLKFTWMSIL